jgi:protoheme IX farnesyltransferase
MQMDSIAASETTFSVKFNHFLGLCKLKVVALILFTAFVGMLLSSNGMMPIQPMVFGLIGIGMAAAAGAAINHVVDFHIDGVMERTSMRPLPQAKLTQKEAAVFAVSLAAVGMLILVVFVNTLTAVLTFVALIGYAVIYTMFLKRSTPMNIVWGGSAGAAPPLLGWAAFT